AISVHQTVAGCLLVTRSNASLANGRGGSSGSATTTTPRGCSFRAAFATLGGHDSVATAVRGKTSASARTSPPPVWMSRLAYGTPTGLDSFLAYPHGCRSSVARPSSQEKSQPDTSADSPSSTSLSK